VPADDYLQKLKYKCEQEGVLLVVDEIQCGFGRTGKLFAFEHYGITPDILCLAKGMGGGMPIGAFISSNEIMYSLSHDPILGHITTFGGHPVSCAAGLATLSTLISERLIEKVEAKEKLFKELLVHPKIKSVNGKGLLLSVSFESYEENKRIIDRCIEKGLITDWFLFNAHSMRIAPPLTITFDEIRWACGVILSSI
jgi:acetylornithine/succinyldiaminopimelate/putrescine aminotransferase